MSEIRFQARDMDRSFPLGDGPIQLSDGFGGWRLVERPDDVALTEWDGVAPLAMQVPILLDGYREGQPVQRQMDRIMKLARRQEDGPPRDFVAISQAMPFSGERFVIEAVEMGDAIRDSDGSLVRQALTVTLREFVRTDRIRIQRRGERRRLYVAKAGDTLLTIAQRLGKDRAFALRIGELNEIRDIRRSIKSGRQLQLPR